jgi:hypothetical protein
MFFFPQLFRQIILKPPPEVTATKLLAKSPPGLRYRPFKRGRGLFRQPERQISLKEGSGFRALNKNFKKNLNLPICCLCEMQFFGPAEKNIR